MTFTNIPTEAVGMIRLLIGDTEEGSGPFPDDRNFSDEEIMALYTRNADLNQTVIEMLEILGRAWAKMVDTTVGPLKENYSQASRSFLSQAENMRSQSGVSGTSFSVAFARDDGYAQAAEEDQYA